VTDHQSQYRHGMQLAYLASLNASVGKDGSILPNTNGRANAPTANQQLVRRPVSNENRSLRAMEASPLPQLAPV
jgi:hypothetical protein